MIKERLWRESYSQLIGRNAFSRVTFALRQNLTDHICAAVLRRNGDISMENEIMNEKSARIVRLDKNNSRFEEKNGFLALIFTDDGVEKRFDRIFLHRAFPHELPFKFISVLGEEKREIGLIYDIEDFDEDAIKLLKAEIERKYYSPVIKEIKSVKERYGFSYWKVSLDDGRDLSFTMQDTFKNILHTSDDSLMLIDVDNNRFTIASVSALSSKSYRKIELYL